MPEIAEVELVRRALAPLRGQLLDRVPASSVKGFGEGTFRV